MLLSGYILVTCHKSNIVTLHVTFSRNETCLLGNQKGLQPRKLKLKNNTLR